MSTQSRSSNSISFICEPNESFFKKVATRTKQKQGKRNTLFHQIPEEDSLQSESDGEPVIEKSTAVSASPTESAVDLEINPPELNLIGESICEDNKTNGSTFTVAGVDRKPNETKETEVSLGEHAKESPETEEKPQKVLATTPKFVCDNTLETPPCLKQIAKGFSTITKRKNRKWSKYSLDLSKGKQELILRAVF